MSRKKVQYEEIKAFIEGPEGNGCKLLTTKEEYESNEMNTRSKLEIKCKCGKTFPKSFHNFKDNKQRQCKECGINAFKIQYEEIKSFIEGHGCELITTKEECEINKMNVLSKLEIKCKCGNTFQKSFNNFKNQNQRQCKECGVSKRSDALKNRIISEETRKKLSDAHKGKKPSEETRNKLSEVRKGKKHPGWKGGRTPISNHLREYIKPWNKDSMKYCNYKSIISGKRFNHIHHVNKSFSEIVELTFEIANIEVKKTIVEYTSEELEKLEKICLMLHYFLGPGICLTEEEHKLFHSLYGKHDNTKEQFEEFKHRFQNREFIELFQL